MIVARRAALLAAAVILAGCGSNTTPAPTVLSTASAPILTPAPTPTLPTATATASASSAAATTLPTAAHRPQTIHVLEDPIDFHTVPAQGCTSAAGCKGDQLVGTSRMLDADTRVAVGSFAVTCVLMDPRKNLYHCPANAISLTGRGEIVFDETVAIGRPDSPLGPWSIISGTGEFLDATGSVASPKDSTWSYGDFVLTITG